MKFDEYRLDGSQKSEDGRKRFNNSLKTSVFGQKLKFIETKVAAIIPKFREQGINRELENKLESYVQTN